MIPDTDINLHRKSFVLIANSKLGTVDNATKFLYQQKGDLVTAEYHGGSISWGTIIGKLVGTRINMLYQCMTTDGVLKAGQAEAKISRTADNKLKMDLDWKWIGDHRGEGTSYYVESG